MTEIELEAELNDLRMSKEAQPLFDAVKRHIAENVDPITEEFFRLGEGRADRWSWAPGQLELLEGAKDKAKAAGLWNFFLPHGDTGTPLSNLDYAYIAAELGKSPLASESLNCSAPDTGNMEVLEMVGTPEQKEMWLKPLLNGEIRSAYVMTEPGVASSDASNLETRARLEGDEWVINGEKYFISGAGDPRCKILICMVNTNPEAARKAQHSQILVPMDTPGVQVLGPMSLTAAAYHKLSDAERERFGRQTNHLLDRSIATMILGNTDGSLRPFEAEPTALASAGTFNFVARWLPVDMALSPRDIAVEVSNLFLHGLRRP